MSRGVCVSLGFLVILIPVSYALYEQNWTIHGVWSASRSFQKTTHFSCTLPAPTPIDNFGVTIESSFSVFTFTTWSLELYAVEKERRAFTFQNIRKMYPPRIVLNFHLTTIGFMEPSGSCSFMLLTERLTTRTTPTTPRSTLPHMGLHHPSWGDWQLSTGTTDDTSTDSTTMSWSTESSTWSSITEGESWGGHTGFSSTSAADHSADPCLEAWITFPPSRYGFPGDIPTPYGSETTTEGAPIWLGRDRPLPGRGGLLRPRRAIFNPGQGTFHTPMRPPLLINYTDAIEKSLMFYAAQRSGNFETAPLYMSYEWVRPSGSFHSAPDGRDLTGGWYNGNDNVKLTFPMAAATTVLAWGYTTWKEVYQYNSSALDEQFKKTIKWPLDYFLKSWDLNNEMLYVQIGSVSKERTIWNRADDFLYNNLWNNNEWPVYSVSPSNPGSDVAAEVAAAMALSSLIEFDIASYSTRLIDTAEEIYRFAKKYPGKYSDVVPVGGDGYPDYTSSGYEDELCFAAAVLFNITGRNFYLDDAVSYFNTFGNGGTPDHFSWDDKRTACAVMLYKSTKEDKYATYLQDFRQHWMATSGRNTPNGFAWRGEEGTLRYTANAIFILLQSIEAGVFEPDVVKEIYLWGAKQIDYMLGANGMQYSYLIGYSDYYVRNPYHKSSACTHPAKPCGWAFYNSEMSNMNKLFGALVGGPDLNDYHADSRHNTIGNSVALDYNAGFQSALAGLQKGNLAMNQACDDYLAATHGGLGPAAPSAYPTPQVQESMSTEETTSPGPVETPTTPYTTTQTKPIPDKPTRFDYADALRKSILFYAAQRSGTEPENNPIPWRRWETVETDTSGGWFDDGSAVKTTKVMASAVAILGWGAVNFKAGYEAAGALSDLHDSLRWPLDYFLNIWDSEFQTLLQKVGSEAYERAFWSRPKSRLGGSGYTVTSFGIEFEGGGDGADVAADVATALAIGSVIFKDNDTEYSGKLLFAAKEVYRFAKQLDRTFKDDSSIYYSDPGDSFDDEMCVAAWWMYKVTQDTSYYNDGMLYTSMEDTNSVLEWKTKNILCHLLLREYAGSLVASARVLDGLDFWTSQVVHTPQGLVWHGYESLKFAANAAFLHALSEDYGVLTEPNHFHREQIDYMLGSNNQAFSYQIGYGNRYPRRPHHRASSCPDHMETCDWSVYNAPGRNPFDLIGALVSGPDKNDVYEDVRSNYTMNRVSVEHNAGFQSALAYLVMKYSLPEETTTTKLATTPTASQTKSNQQETTTKKISTQSQTSTSDPYDGTPSGGMTGPDGGGKKRTTPEPKKIVPNTDQIDPQNEISSAKSLTGSLSTVLYFTFILISYFCS